MTVDLDALTSAAVMAAFAVPGRVIFKRDRQTFMTIDGVFDRYQIEAMGEDGAALSIKKSVVGVRQADFPPGVTPAAGDRVQILGKTFDVFDVQPDGLGWITLPLGFVANAGP
jgi:hypothetical protein